MSFHVPSGWSRGERRKCLGSSSSTSALHRQPTSKCRDAEMPRCSYRVCICCDFSEIPEKVPSLRNSLQLRGFAAKKPSLTSLNAFVDAIVLCRYASRPSGTPVPLSPQSYGWGFVVSRFERPSAVRRGPFGVFRRFLCWSIPHPRCWRAVCGPCSGFSYRCWCWPWLSSSWLPRRCVGPAPKTCLGCSKPLRPRSVVVAGTKGAPRAVDRTPGRGGHDESP